jgi:hypothetical protein
LEGYFGKPFIRVRPDFLRNHVVSGKNLEIDCYNDELKLAVEFQGRQHYQFIPHFHKNKGTYHNQLYRDELKREKCRQNGVKLIEVPWNVNVGTYLEEQLRINGYGKENI